MVVIFLAAFFQIPTRRTHGRLKTQPADDLLQLNVAAALPGALRDDPDTIRALDVAAVEAVQVEAARRQSLQEERPRLGFGVATAYRANLVVRFQFGGGLGLTVDEPHERTKQEIDADNQGCRQRGPQVRARAGKEADGG